MTQENDYRARLAKYFLIAYLADRHDVTFRTAEGYIKGKGEVGEFWLLLADFAIKSMNKFLDDKYGDDLGKVIQHDQVD